MRQTNLRNVTMVLIFGWFLLFARLTFAEVHATDEFIDGSTRPVSLALLPARVELLKQRMLRMEAEVDESGELESFLTDAVAVELQSRGYDLHVVDADAINADPQLQELVVDADRRYAEMITSLGRKLSKRIDQRRYNAGDEMKLLASKLDVDAIAYVQMQLIAQAKASARSAWASAARRRRCRSVSLMERRAILKHSSRFR